MGLEEGEEGNVEGEDLDGEEGGRRRRGLGGVGREENGGGAREERKEVFVDGEGREVVEEGEKDEGKLQFR